MSEQNPTPDPTPDPDPTPTPDPKDVELQALRKDSTKYHRRAQEAEASLTALQGKILSDGDRELFEALKAAQAQAAEEKAKKEGQYTELLAKKQEAFDSTLSDERGRGDTFQTAFESVAVKAPIQAELAKAGVTDVSAAAHLIQTLHPQRAKATLVNGVAVVQVVDAQGTLIQDETCEPGQSIGIDKLVAGFLATDTGKHFLPPSKDTGSGAHQGTSISGANVALLLADPEKRAEFIEEHGGPAWVKLTDQYRLQQQSKQEK